MTSQNHCITISLSLRTKVSWSYHIVVFPVFPTHNVYWLNTNMHMLLYPQSFLCVQWSRRMNWCSPRGFTNCNISCSIIQKFTFAIWQTGWHTIGEGTSCQTVPWYLDSCLLSLYASLPITVSASFVSLTSIRSLFVSSHGTAGRCC